MQAFKFMRNVKLGIKNLLLHKLRSILTMLGVVFGVGSVVAMLSVGEGASKEALERIRMLGSNNIILEGMKPVEEEAAGAMRNRMSIYGLLYADEARVRESFAAVRRTVPIKIIRQEGRLKDRTLELRVVATVSEWFDLVSRPLLAGRTLTQRDLDEKAPVAVLTEHGARRLLAANNSIGQTLRIGKEYFEVIGIVKNEQAQAGGLATPDKDVDAYVPLSLARERFGDMVFRRTSGSEERERVELHQMIVQVDSTDDVEAVASGIEAMLRRFHKRVDYKMSVPLALLRQAEQTKRTFNIVLGSIAGISLLVGGIGIMNIMLASVTERTREIGIRRAIGAKRRQIIIQFLIETMTLSTIGGMIGIAIGVLFPFIIEYFADMPTVVTAQSLVLSVGISMFVGVVFGLYPAYRAANLDPIQALRHE
jgi:putative ABC transport system permease protein